MKLVYEAANSLEGHMVLNLLVQVDLSARIDGEYLQGGIGELQAFGAIRIMVEEDDYIAAKEIVQDWDAKQVGKEPPVDVVNKSKSVFVTVILLAIGIAAASIFFTP